MSNGHNPDCLSGADTCDLQPQSAVTPSIWNPLPSFTDVGEDGQYGDVKPIETFYQAAKGGKLPNVSWLSPSLEDSEHPPANISTGQSYVTSAIDAVMTGPDWDSTAIFLAWDDWGGFYDNVKPVVVDKLGYGFRVPGLVISPYAKSHYIDHQTLSFDAYIKFIEDDFLAGARLDPKTDGRPDPRPDVREDAPQLGNLVSDFDFNQAPRPPDVLPVRPHTDLVGTLSIPKGDNGLPTGSSGHHLIRYIIIAGVVIAALAIGIGFFLRRRRRPGPPDAELSESSASTSD